MDKGIYTALSGGIAKSHELEIIANNLANANTPGFKRDTGTFQEYLTEARRTEASPGDQLPVEGRPTNDKSFVELDGIYTDYRQGQLQSTGRPLDLALEGNGFFEVLTPSGLRYTRQGNFSVSSDGRLVTANGYQLLAVAPENDQRIPPESRAIRVGQGVVQISPDGRVFQNGAELARVSVREFREDQLLEKAGNSYYRNTRDENLISGGVRSRLHQGFLESSNVNPVSEMTRLIETTRAYESHLQVIKTYQEIDAKSVSDIAGVR